MIMRTVVITKKTVVMARTTATLLVLSSIPMLPCSDV